MTGENRVLMMARWQVGPEHRRLSAIKQPHPSQFKSQFAGPRTFTTARGAVAAAGSHYGFQESGYARSICRPTVAFSHGGWPSMARLPKCLRSQPPAGSTFIASTSRFSGKGSAKCSTARWHLARWVSVRGLWVHPRRCLPAKRRWSQRCQCTLVQLMRGLDHQGHPVTKLSGHY